MTRRFVCLVAIAVGAASLSTTAALASTWDKGDLFLGVSNGTYQVRTNTGVFKENLTTSSSFTTGCALDKSGNFYGTWFGVNNVFRFDGVHPHAVSAFGSGYGTPESFVFDAVGNAYVGNLNNGIRMFNSSGTFIKTVINTRVDFFDIAADQDTILYTQEGIDIKRVSIATGASLSNFTTGTGTQAFALRILPDGGVLLADRVNVKRYNAAGAVIQTYTAAGESSWFSLNLDPNGTSFWAGNFNTNNVYKFNIATGAQEATFNTGAGGQLFGICLKGEPTVAAGDTTKPLCRISKTILGPPKAIEVTVQDTGSGLASIQVTSSTNTSVTGNTGFTVGTNAEVVVTGTKINQSLSSSFTLRVTDVAGNFTICDPVLHAAIRESGKPVTETFTGVPQAESKVTIHNGNPGVKNLELNVNGTTFKVTGLKDDAIVNLDISSAMRAGNDNTITVTAHGKPGAGAFVVISD